MSDLGDTKGPVERSAARRGAGRPAEDQGLGGVLREVLGQPGIRGGLSLGRLVLGWGGVVGAVLAAETSPRALERGVLVVAASTPAWGVQVRFLAAEVRRRANMTLGSDVVREVRVVVRPEASKRLSRNDSDAEGWSPEPPRQGPSSDRI